MRIVLRGLVWMLLACVAASSALAAAPPEFYLTMLRRGVAAHDAGRFDNAASMLRIAAFGFLDSVEQYQTAEMYLALSYDRLGDAERARDAARKVVTAERVERHYASLSVPAETRASFDALARRALTEAEMAVLARTAASVPQAATAKPEPPKAEPPKAVPQVATAKPAPKPEAPKPEAPKPVPVKAAAEPPQSKAAAQPPHSETPKPRNPVTPTQPAPINVPSRFAEAERLLTAARLPEARAIYRELLDKAALQRADLLRLAEGFYRARDFAHALRTFERIGELRRGEQPYRYYIAVALYETGQYRRAKDEMAAALPFIEVTPDVERYRAKIQGAVN